MKKWNLLAFVVLSLGLASLCLSAGPTSKGERSHCLLDQIKVSEPVEIKVDGGRYTLTFWPGSIRPLPHTVVGVGADYVGVKDRIGLTETLISIYSISAVKHVHLNRPDGK